MKKIILLVIGIALLVSCYTTYGSFGRLNDYSAIREADRHAVAIAAIYEMGEGEYIKRLEEKRKHVLHISLPHGIAIPVPYQLQLSIPLEIPSSPNKFIAYLGAGEVISDGDKYSYHALTCSHVLSHDENTLNRKIWIFKEGLDHAVEADLVAKSGMDPWIEDYAVVKMRKHLGLPGLKIAEPGEVAKFDKVIFSGSVGGLAFFSRMVNMTDFRQFFNRGEDGYLHLSHWTPYKFWIFYPGGGGDSGGSACTLNGKIFTVMAWGISVYDEQYIMGNPVEMLWAFLHKHNLDYLGR